MDACQPVLRVRDAIILPARSVSWTVNLRWPHRLIKWAATCWLPSEEHLTGSGATLTLQHVPWWYMHWSPLGGIMQIRCCTSCQTAPFKEARGTGLLQTMRRAWSIAAHVVLTLYLCCRTCIGKTADIIQTLCLWSVKHVLNRTEYPGYPGYAGTVLLALVSELLHFGNTGSLRHSMDQLSVPRIRKLGGDRAFSVGAWVKVIKFRSNWTGNVYRLGLISFKKPLETIWFRQRFTDLLDWLTHTTLVLPAMWSALNQFVILRYIKN